MISAMIAAATTLFSEATPPGCGLPALPGGARPWPAGETLSFDVDVMGIVKAGSLTLAADEPMMGQIPVRARVRNTSVFAKVRKLQGSALSWLDEKTLRPARYRDEVVEDGVRRVTDARIPEGSRQLVIETQSGNRKAQSTFERDGPVLDLLSAIYYLRAAALRPGQEICADLVANRRFWRLRARVAEKPERVEAGAGVFEARRLDGSMVRADNPAVKRSLHLWISSDARRLPVAAVGEVDIGPVRAMLSRVTPE